MKRMDRMTANASGISHIKALCADDGLAVVRLTYNASYPYCSSNGATYVVVYKVDDNYIYLQNANNRSSSAAMLSSYVSNQASWVLQLYGFKA